MDKDGSRDPSFFCLRFVRSENTIVCLDGALILFTEGGLEGRVAASEQRFGFSIAFLGSKAFAE